MKKELLTVEFRYRDKPKGDWDSTCKTTTITIGLYDTLEEAVAEGNKVLEVLAQTFQVRADDAFSMKGLMGSPMRLVTNTCYPTNGVQYFAKITPLKYGGLVDMVTETFTAMDRYKQHLKNTSIQ